MGIRPVLVDAMVAWNGQEKVRAYKKIDVWKLPAVVICHLKRFYFNEWGGGTRIEPDSVWAGCGCMVMFGRRKG